MFCINTLTSELDGICIPAMRCLRVTHVIKVTTEIAYRFGDCLSASLADLASHGTSTILHIGSSCHSILAPDRLTLAVPIPLTVPLNRVHCPQRFIPNPFRMVGRILVVEHQVALSKTFLLNSPVVHELINCEKPRITTYIYATSCRN